MTLWTFDQLRAARCRPLGVSDRWSMADVQAHLHGPLSAWTWSDHHLECEFRFANYHATLAFVNALAWIAHQEDHHPELVVKYDTCKVRFQTHTAQGVSLNDLICAAKVTGLCV